MKTPPPFFAVPPTVRRSTFIVGIPTPTGTAWPSFPQVPTPSSSLRSLPTMETRVSTSGPLPINVAPLIGAVIWPSSIRRSEEHTSELQSLAYLVCRLLLEKKNDRRRDK